MSWGQDQKSDLVIGISTAGGIATATHLPCKLGGTGELRSQLAKSSIEIFLLDRFSDLADANRLCQTWHFIRPPQVEGGERATASLAYGWESEIVAVSEVLAEASTV